MNHPDYSILAARVLTGKIYKNTPKSFSTWVRTFGSGTSTCPYSFIASDLSTGPRAILRQDFVSAVEKHSAELDEAIVHARDRGFYLCVNDLPSVLSTSHIFSVTLCRCYISTTCFVGMVP